MLRKTNTYFVVFVHLFLKKKYWPNVLLSIFGGLILERILYQKVLIFYFIYLIGQNFVGQNFRRTKYFVGQNFRHQAEISTLLSDLCLTFVLKHQTKFSTDKIFRLTKFLTPSRNFDNFVRRFLFDKVLHQRVLHQRIYGIHSLYKVFKGKPKIKKEGGT